jgi:hypothetical protein
MDQQTCPSLWPTANAVSVLFFPQREQLGLDSRRLSPGMVSMIVFTGGEVHSSKRASILLKRMGMEVSCNTVQRVLGDVGDELIDLRDHDKLSFERIESPPQLAVVQCDGGRILTRHPNQGPGVHQQAWKETKNAGLFRMTSEEMAEDPHPALPAAFADEFHVAQLAEMQRPEEAAGTPEIPAFSGDSEQPSLSGKDGSHRPRVLVRTVLSSMADSKTFGHQMKHEAKQRRFDEASRRAFVGDGLPWNWSIQQEHFSDFVAILDFIHVASYLYAAAAIIEESQEAKWACYLRLATDCWQGKSPKVVGELHTWLLEHGVADPTKIDKEHALRAVVDAWRYLSNNRTRMDYPAYRRKGLPVTSSLMESLVKQINLRVKGTEMFWDRPQGAERILQIRAAILSDDDRMERYLRIRPGCPYVRRSTSHRRKLEVAA